MYVDAIIGLRVLVATVGALSVGLGAGFQNAFDDAWDVAHLPTAPPAAAPFNMPRAHAHPPKVVFSPHVRIVHANAHNVIHVSQVRVTHVRDAHAAVTRVRENPMAVRSTRVVAAPRARAAETAIAARNEEEPVYEVAPSAAPVATSLPNPGTVAVPKVTATPSPVPTAAPREPSWLQRQLGHFDPFKPYKSAPTPTPNPKESAL